jgi:dolichol-phosphate mannosyltransferase
MSKFLIIVPTYNEADNIQTFLADLLTFIHNNSSSNTFSILNVDDNSPDGTAGIVQEIDSRYISQIIRPAKFGLGPAYLAGFTWGLARDFDFFIEIDADGSHSIYELTKLLEVSSPGKLVIGTRWISGGSVINWPWYRRAISRFGTKYAALALALPYRDLTSGYRVIAWDVLNAIDLDSVHAKGYGFQIEMVMKAATAGFEIVEVPITFTERTKGKSKMTFSIALEAFLKITQWGFQRITN